MGAVTLERAGPERARALANLFQLYVHDFSEHWAGETRGEVGEDGRFEPYPLEPFFRSPDREALLIRADGRLVGFALVDAETHSGSPADFNMAEFFVVRKHRRAGVGRSAALAVIGNRPGLWEIAVTRKNVSAQAFWRGVAREAAGEGEVEELNLRDERWNGPILRFRSAR